MKNGLLEFLQSASNAVAGNVAGPVDLLGMGLNKIGVPVGAAPVGGTEWMKRQGLMRDVQQGPARVLGETAGLLGPALATQFAPQIAKGLLQAGDNLAAPRTLNKEAGAIVWHGSKDPRWIDRGEDFSAAVPAANMQSNFLWVNPKKEVAENYAGITELQRWKAENGMGAAPAPSAGVRKFDLADDAKILKVKDVRKASKQVGVEWTGPTPLESLLEAAKARGYDAVKMEVDGGNIAVLNPARLSRK